LPEGVTDIFISFMHWILFFRIGSNETAPGCTAIKNKENGMLLDKIR
jgi:hypothetical protein